MSVSINNISYFELEKFAYSWPGFCQIYRNSSGYSLNFSRVPMIPQLDPSCKPYVYSSLATALDDAILKVANLKNHPQLQPSYIKLFKELT